MERVQDLIKPAKSRCCLVRRNQSSAVWFCRFRCGCSRLGYWWCRRHLTCVWLWSSENQRTCRGRSFVGFFQILLGVRQSKTIRILQKGELVLVLRWCIFQHLPCFLVVLNFVVSTFDCRQSGHIRSSLRNMPFGFPSDKAWICKLLAFFSPLWLHYTPPNRSSAKGTVLPTERKVTFTSGEPKFISTFTGGSHRNA